MRIEGSSALVTGGASGLGQATVQRLVQQGAKSVVFVDLPTSAGQQVAEELGPAARFVAADITDETGIEAALDVSEQAGPLRAVVHCAGRGGDRTRIVDKSGIAGPLANFEDVIRINLVGSYNVLRLAAARMSRNDLEDGERGAIVLTASVAAFEGQIGQTSYTASKSGIHGMTLVAARDLASWSIRVNSIAPGLFATPPVARAREDIRQSLADAVPFPKRLGEPDEFAHMAQALLENTYANGHTLRLDGAIRMAPR